MIPLRVTLRHSHTTLLFDSSESIFRASQQPFFFGSKLSQDRASTSDNKRRVLYHIFSVGIRQLHLWCGSGGKVLTRELYKPGRVALVLDDFLSKATWIENSWSGKGPIVTLGTLFAAGSGSSVSP